MILNLLPHIISVYSLEESRLPDNILFSHEYVEHFNFVVEKNLKKIEYQWFSNSQPTGISGIKFIPTGYHVSDGEIQRLGYDELHMTILHPPLNNLIKDRYKQFNLILLSLNDVNAKFDTKKDRMIYNKYIEIVENSCEIAIEELSFGKFYYL